LGPDDDTEAGMRRRLLEMMREGGCPQPNNVLAAARRIFQDGEGAAGWGVPVWRWWSERGTACTAEPVPHHQVLSLSGHTGLDPKGSIRPADILTVRECGNSLVETFRQRAMKVRWKAAGLY
jgi:hypothetical protein